jgi:hypothetical protein
VIENIVGTTILRVKGAKSGSKEIRILTSAGELLMHHEQECCECVQVEDVTGEPADIIGALVSLAEERVNPLEIGEYGEYGDSATWTFYEIRTTKGDITIRWLGTSNGYYSESVDLEWVPANAG